MIRRIVSPIFALVLLFAVCVAHAQNPPPPAVVKPADTAVVAATASEFDASTGSIIDSRWKSGVPMGGIGVGKIELMSDGSFANFTTNSNWDRPYPQAKGAFAAVWAQAADGQSIAKLLRLRSDNEYADVSNIGHTRMRGLFPRGAVTFEDADLPIQVRLAAFSPLIPHDTKDSALPVVFLAYTVTNTGRRPVHASVLLAWPNLIGWGGRDLGPYVKVPVVYDSVAGNGQTPSTAGDLTGLHYTTTQSYTDVQQNTVGDWFVGARQETGMQITHCSNWDANSATPPFWHSFAHDGTLHGVPGPAASPAGALAARVTLQPGQFRTVRFAVVWAMPHMVVSHGSEVYAPSTIGSNEGVELMFDTDATTRWTTKRVQHAGDNLVVDLGSGLPVAPARVAMRTSAQDYPRGLRIEVSSDGSTWSQVASFTAAQVLANVRTGDGVFDAPLTPVHGRYLRLTCLGSDPSFWWSIWDLKVTAEGASSPLPLSGKAATAYLMQPVVRSEDLGRYWQNWFQTSPQIAAYAEANYSRFDAETSAWQTLLEKSNLPFWLQLKVINCSFPVVSNTVLTRAGRFAIQESPVIMAGATGTMDQRLAAHTFYTALFPELDRAELELFASVQRPDGQISHMDGNVYTQIGSADVLYGVTGWPDLSCSWALQTAQMYRWTGDIAFLSRMQPHVTRAMQFLRSADHDGDSIPEGGSTYDYEHHPAGSFIYTASCYLGALRAASALARASGDPSLASSYDDRLALTQKSVMSELWNGVYFRKWNVPTSGEMNQNSFVANMAGDWAARLAGLPRTLTPEIIHRSVAQTISRHLKPFSPIPPMEVTPNGAITTGACYALQHEPYLGCEAIYENYADDGLDMIRRIYYCAWILNKDPWNESLVYWSPDGHRFGFPYYMTSPTSWNTLFALAGASLNVPRRILYLSPRLPDRMTELHMPIFFPRFWGWLDYVPAAHRMTLQIKRVFPPDSNPGGSLFALDQAPNRQSSRAPEATLTIASVAADGDATVIALERPFIVRENALLDLSSLLPRLAPPLHSAEVEAAPKP